MDLKKIVETMKPTERSNQEGLNIAITTLMQLGGPAFRLCTGSRIGFASFPAYHNYYGLLIGLQKTDSKANYLLIIYNRAADLYDMFFYYHTATEFEVVKTEKGCYAEDLTKFFHSETGLYCAIL